MCLKSELTKARILEKFGFQELGFQTFTVFKNFIKLLFYLVGVHDAKGFLELLDGTLGEHGEDIASALLGFPEKILRCPCYFLFLF